MTHQNLSDLVWLYTRAKYERLSVNTLYPYLSLNFRSHRENTYRIIAYLETDIFVVIRIYL